MNSAIQQRYTSNYKTPDHNCINKTKMTSKASQLKQADLRIVLLGKTGVGKSASGNSILGRDSFTVSLSPASETGEWKEETKVFEGKTLAIVDTPGLFHTTKECNMLVHEILECTLNIQPGPHMLLLVVKLGLFTSEDKNVLQTFQKVFTGAKRHTIVLFTHRGRCEAEVFIEKHKSLKDFVEQSCVKYHVFDNDAKDEAQVSNLLQDIFKVVQGNGGRFYSNNMLEAAEQALKAMQCVKVTCATAPEEKGKTLLRSWITKGFAELEQLDPGLFKSVNSFLKIVQDVAYKCMPVDCTRPQR